MFDESCLAGVNLVYDVRCLSGVWCLVFGVWLVYYICSEKCLVKSVCLSETTIVCFLLKGIWCMFDESCMLPGVCLVYDVWWMMCDVFGVWCMMLGEGCLMSIVWYLMSSVCLVYDKWWKVPGEECVLSSEPSIVCFWRLSDERNLVWDVWWICLVSVWCLMSSFGVWRMICGEKSGVLCVVKGLVHYVWWKVFFKRNHNSVFSGDCLVKCIWLCIQLCQCI